MRPKLRIALTGGRAEQNRAPVDDLVLLLQEVQALVLAFGRQRAGAEVPEAIVRSSCQLEVVGLSFGSIAPELELAYFVDQEPNAIGLSALEDTCRVFSALRTETVPALSLAPSVVDHIERVTELLDRGYSRIETTFNYNGQHLTGVVDHELRAYLVADEASALAVEDVSVRGLLFGLKDRPSERQKHFFSGDLLDEAGQTWGVRFRLAFADEARGLWRKPVELTGTARYSKIRRPVLFVERAAIAPETSWQAILSRVQGSWRGLYEGMSLDDILRELR